MEVACAPYLLSWQHPEAMRKAFGAGVAHDHRFEGASFWILTR
jgi:hypothetical protein